MADVVMSDEVRQELEGFVEAWRDDAAAARQEAANTQLAFAAVEATARALVYDEAADELEALLARRKPAEVETLEPCTCDPGHICDGNRGHYPGGCPHYCPVHRDSAGRQVMPKVQGQSFRCDCGCNVFTELSAPHYRCNACGARFKGE